MRVRKSGAYILMGIFGIAMGIVAIIMAITEPSESDYAYCLGIPVLIGGIFLLSRGIHHLKREF